MLHVIYNGPKARVEIIVSSQITGMLPNLRQRPVHGGAAKSKRKAERTARKKNRRL